jgi:ribosome maturation factor RimP
MGLISTKGLTVKMNWQVAIERTVNGLGYDLVDVERSARGLLRVSIDRVPGRVYETGEGESIMVDDCEQVTRQLQFVLEVEGLDYERLEVSSPGLDRPLKRPADWERFAGCEINLTLRVPFQNRRTWRGVLSAHENGWQICFDDGKGEQALAFTLDEVREARLVPVLNFKGRSATRDAAADNGGQER